MKQIGYAKTDLSWAQVELEPGDELVLAPDGTFYFTDKDGNETFTSKVNYPLLSGAVFLGRFDKEDIMLWVTDPKWVAGAIKALKAESDDDIKVMPFEDEAEARKYIRENANFDPDFREIGETGFWEVI